jgi:nucleotide-binding universal stress UspA family protein
MSRFHHILFPIDFSERCRAVRPFVKSMAGRFDAKVTLMHVIQTPAGWYCAIDAGAPITFDVSAMEVSAEEEMHDFFESPRRPGTCAGIEEAVRVGDPATEISKYAEEHAVDLIMMPTHGYGKFRAWLLGSVVAKVLHDAKCEVWTAAHTQDPHLPEHLGCKNVMGAVDLAPATVPLIQRYVDLADEFNAKLRLVHAVPGAAPDAFLGLDQTFPSFLIQAAREELARLQVRAGTNLEVCMEGGPVSKIVAAAARHHDADLVMVGRGTLTETLGQLRSNTYSIIRDAPCPVLTV